MGANAVYNVITGRLSPSGDAEAGCLIPCLTDKVKESGVPCCMRESEVVYSSVDLILDLAFRAY